MATLATISTVSTTTATCSPVTARQLNIISFYIPLKNKNKNASAPQTTLWSNKNANICIFQQYKRQK